MPIDINKVKQKLSQLQAKGKKNADGSFEKIDFKKVYWKPKLGEQIVRFIPFKNNPSMPFIEVEYHNFIPKKKILALTNFGEKDPVVEFSNQLKSSSDKEEKDYGYKMAPRKKYVAQLVPRGEEANGARLFEMNKTASQELLAIIANDDYGDILDVNDGFDVTITGVEDSFNGTTFIQPKLMPKRKPTPLADTEDAIKGFLNNQYDPLTLNKKYTYQELKDILAKWLNPEETEQESENEEVVENTDEASKDDIDELPFVEEVDQESEDEEPPFDPDPLPEPEVTPAKNAIAAASKKVIAKNNAEIKAAAEKVVKSKKETKVKAEVKKESEVVKGGDTQSKKDKFAALFGKK